MRRGVVLLLLAGCRLGFDDSSEPRDSGLVTDGLSQPGDATDANAPSDGSQLSCPGTYSTVSGQTSKYRAVDNSTPWLTSQQQCEADGTHLVIVDNAAEITAMMGLLSGQNIWVGTTDRVVIGTWRHVTGATATFLPWDSSEPDATSPECVFIDSLTAKLADQDCGSGRRFVCECDGVAVDPSSY